MPSSLMGNPAGNPSTMIVSPLPWDSPAVMYLTTKHSLSDGATVRGIDVR